MTCERCGDVDGEIDTLFDSALPFVLHHDCMLCRDCYREWIKVSAERVGLFVESAIMTSVSCEAKEAREAAVHGCCAVGHEMSLIKLYGDWLKGTRVE